mgnify:FL=1
MSLVAKDLATSTFEEVCEILEIQNFKMVRLTEERTNPATPDANKVASGLLVVPEMDRSLNGGENSSIADDIREVQGSVGHLSPRGGVKIHQNRAEAPSLVALNLDLVIVAVNHA